MLTASLVCIISRAFCSSSAAGQKQFCSGTAGGLQPGADKRQIGTFFPSIIFWRVQLIPYFSNRFPEENSILLTYTTQKNQNSLDLCGFTIDFAKINQKTCLLIEIIIKKSQHGTFSPYILKKVHFLRRYVIGANLPFIRLCHFLVPVDSGQ